MKNVTAFPSRPARPVRPILTRQRMHSGQRTSRTDPVHVALHARREIVVDYLPHAFEVHTSGHDFRADHYPALAPPHSAYGVLTLLVRQARVQAVDVCDSGKNKFFGE